jgi:hypothetical protein
MKSLFNRLVMASVAVLVMGRLGYLGYEKHVAPRIDAFMSPTAAVENQSPLSAAGYDMLSALRKFDDWELDANCKYLKHKASGKIMIGLTRDDKGSFFYYTIKVPSISFAGDRIDNFYTPEDLKAIDKASMALANNLRERTVSATRDKLQKALGVSSTDVQVKEALKTEVKPVEVPAPAFPSPATNHGADTKQSDSGDTGSVAVANAGLKFQLPWYERNSTLMVTSIGGMIVTTLFMGWVARHQNRTA